VRRPFFSLLSAVVSITVIATPSTARDSARAKPGQTTCTRGAERHPYGTVLCNEDHGRLERCTPDGTIFGAWVLLDQPCGSEHGYAPKNPAAEGH
jgi:hypothetical protein